MKSQHFFYLGFAVLLLALLGACGQAPITKPETGQPAPAEIVAPQTEDQPLPTEAEATSGSVFYAANPDLMVAGRNPASVDEKPVTGSAHYAANPELMAVGRYPAPVAEIEAVTGSAFYAANPELMVARRSMTK